MAQVHGVIHFVDGTSLKLSWKQQGGDDPATIIKNVKKAIDADKFIIETDGDLMIIPSQNIKYFHITPGPKALPQDDVLRNVSILS